MEPIETEDLGPKHCKGGEPLRMSAECWLEWQRCRRHDNQVKALGATLTRSTSGTALFWLELAEILTQPVSQRSQATT